MGDSMVQVRLFLGPSPGDRVCSIDGGNRGELYVSDVSFLVWELQFYVGNLGCVPSPG